MTIGLRPGFASRSSSSTNSAGSTFAAPHQRSAPSVNESRPEAIYLWHVDLKLQDRRAGIEILSPDEKQRASNLRDLAARNRWINSRAALRRILAHHTELRAEDIHFEYGPYGKPRLVRAKRRRQPLYFSVARSADLCLVAVSRDRPVGIDVARMTGGDRIDHIARQFFSIQEAAAIRKASGERHHVAFLNAWTRREAYAKAIGIGVPLSLRGVRVSVEDCGRPAIVALDHDDPAKWTLIALRPSEGYVGALAVRDGGVKGQTVVHAAAFDFDLETEIDPSIDIDAVVAA